MGLSPDGSLLYIEGGQYGQENAEDNYSFVYVIDVEGGLKAEIPNWPIIFSYPAWSPDSSTLFFNSSGPNNNWKGFYTLKIADNRFEWYMADENMAPVISPDGSQMLWRSLGGKLKILDLATGEEWVVAGGWWDEYKWHPSGDKITYSVPGGNYSHIYTILTDGSEKTQLPDDARMDNRDPKFSPDGEWVLYEAYTYPSDFGIKTLGWKMPVLPSRENGGSAGQLCVDNSRRRNSASTDHRY